MNPADALLSEDPRLARALEAYFAQVEAGQRPDRQEFLARYPDLAGPLAECLDGLDFVRDAAPELQPPDPDAPTGVAVGTPLGDFRLLGEVGRGGMGVVYEAEQLSLGRRVALKVLPFAAALDAKQLQRFKNEAHAAAQLHHTNIVPVYGVGCERGVHYYAMQLIDGQSLAAAIAQSRQTGGVSPLVEVPAGADTPCLLAATEPTPTVAERDTARSIRTPAYFRAVARLGVQAAEALEHAHQEGVVHRDIKPANLLVDGHGKLWITDFGLARLPSQAGLTLTGDVLGTLRYMSPEQALGQRDRVDHRSDVYSLGATLYELLTLEPACPGQDRQEVLRQIEHEEPRPPRRLNPAVPAELETIVLKAMAKDAAERYATAQELADDLERFLQNRPIKGRKPSLVQRVRKWARRHRPVVATALASLLAGLVLALALLLLKNAEIRSEQEQTQAEKQKADEALQRERQVREQLELLLYFRNIQLANRELGNNNLQLAEELLAQCPTPRRQWEWHYLKRLCQGERLVLRGHTGRVWGLAFSPNGRLLATAGADRTVCLWETATGRLVSTLEGHAGAVRCVTFDPDGERLVSAGEDKVLRLWEVQTGREVAPLGRHERPVWSVAFSPDGRYLASAGEEKDIRVWDVRAGQEIRRLAGHTGEVASVVFSPNGRQLASAGYDGSVRLWDVATGQEDGEPLLGHARYVESVAFSRDGRRLASGGSDWAVIVWDVATRRSLHALRRHGGKVMGLSFSPDGQRLASASTDWNVKLWDLTTGREVLAIAHRERVCAVAFSPDGRLLVTAGDEAVVRVCNGTWWQEKPEPPAAEPEK